MDEEAVVHIYNGILIAIKRKEICRDLESPRGEGNGTPLQNSCLENPWTEEPGGLQSMGSLRVGHD